MNQNKRRGILTPATIALAVVLGIFIGMFAGRHNPRMQAAAFAREITRNSNKLTQTIGLINKLYVDPVNTDSIVEALMPDLMGGLDPHSVYIPAAEMARANESLDGEFDGIGVMFNMATDTVIVLSVITNGPSYKAGIQNGDRIIMIDDSPVAGQKIPQDDIVRMLRGRRGTEVTVSVERQGIAGLVPVTIVRDKVPIKSIDAAFILEPGIGFVRLSTFSRNTHTEMVKAIDWLVSEGMRKLILDLRGNAGGFLDQAILLTNEFLPEGKLIVYTEDRSGKQEKQFSNGRGRYQDLQLAVLIDEGSASSSEILAGAIQDNDRGIIVGRRSFGKGLVQQQIPFADGSAIRLTTARYYTPTGRSIQKPFDDYDDEIFMRYLHSEVFSADSVRFNDSLRYETPGGRIVYGGGGIMPDIFVPIDTTEMTNYFYEVRGRNILYRFTIEYSDRHREQINAITTTAELNALLDGDKNLLNDFVKYAARNGVAPDWSQIRKSERLIMSQLSGYIGRNTPLEDSGFFSGYYKGDDTILKALEALRE